MFRLIAVQPSLHSGPLRAARFAENLGGEQGFKVSLQASQCLKTYPGMTIYPFNLGDVAGLEVSTGFLKGRNEVVSQNKWGYTPTAGLLEVRQALATEINRRFGIKSRSENISIGSCKGSLFAFIKAYLNPEDTILIPHPAYPIYESVAKGIGATVHRYDYEFETSSSGNKVKINLAAMESQLQIGAKILVINDDHNPTGATMTESEARQLEAILDRFPDTLVLFDIAYFMIRFEGQSEVVGLVQKLFNEGRGIILYTGSKELAVPGERIGGIVYPNRFLEDGSRMVDPHLKIVGNDHSCPSITSQLELQYALNDTGFQDGIQTNVTILKNRRDVLFEALSLIQGLEPTLPKGGFYVWVNAGKAIDRTETGNVDTFRKLLLRSTGVSFCTGAHFGMDDEATLIRLAFSAIRSQKEATALGNPTIEAAMVKLNNWMTERDAAIQFWTGKNILVFGGGPIGMHVAGCLSAYTKATVTMVTRDADRLSGGYVIEFPTGKETMRPNVVKPGREGELGQADVAIVAVKNGEIPPGLRAVVGDHTRIICFQNGVDGNAIADAFPDNPVDRVAIYVQTRRLEKEVGITIPKEIKWVFGPARATGDAAATAEIARMFGHAGLYNATGIDHKHHTTASWEKLFNNIGNYAALRLAVANEGRTYGDVLSDSPAAKEARALMIKAVEEATEIAIAHGVELKHRHYGEAVLTYLKTTHVCTTVAAFENGDPIEVLLAPVIQLGKAYGHSTDALEAINQPVLDHNAARTPHPEIKTRLSESELEHRLQVCITEISVVPT